MSQHDVNHDDDPTVVLWSPINGIELEFLGSFEIFKFSGHGAAPIGLVSYKRSAMMFLIAPPGLIWRFVSFGCTRLGTHFLVKLHKLGRTTQFTLRGRGSVTRFVHSLGNDYTVAPRQTVSSQKLHTFDTEKHCVAHYTVFETVSFGRFFTSGKSIVSGAEIWAKALMNRR